MSDGDMKSPEDFAADQLLASKDLDIARARKEATSLRAALKVAEGERQELEHALTIARTIDGCHVEAPKWAKRKVRKKHRATALAMLSDTHFDEVVKPEEMQGFNKYNRTIAEMRLRNTFEGILTLSDDLLSGFSWDGVTLLLGGDMVSGNIHDELRESNEAPPTATVDYWVDPMAAGIEMLAESFGKVHIVGVVGNHGRNTRKPRMKGRVEDNFDWMMYRVLYRHFHQDDRITFNIPLSPDAYFEIYGHRHLLTHGDQAKGGSGISGLLTPISLLEHRKRKRDQAAAELFKSFTTASHMWLGHWHQYLKGATWTVNGSLKGIDEHAFQGNFGFEVPAQAFAVITPKHNVTMQAPIYSQDIDVEGWRDQSA